MTRSRRPTVSFDRFVISGDPEHFIHNAISHDQFLALPGDEMVLWQVTPLGGGSGHSMTIDALRVTLWSGNSPLNGSEEPSHDALSLDFNCDIDDSCSGRTLSCGVEDISCNLYCPGPYWKCTNLIFNCVHNASLKCGISCGSYACTKADIC